jgi:hypothetical protein
MKRLISTTAIATCLALPIAAQQATQSGTQTGQVQTQAGTTQSVQLEIQASDLIGKRLYIEREAADQAGMTEQPPQQTQQQQAQTGQQPVEGQQEQQQEAQTGQQQVQPQQDQQQAQTGMESEPAGQPQMTGQQMTGMEQGVTNPRDHWQTAGQITDVLLSQEGEVQALVIDAGGFLGGDQRERRIDIQEVQFVQHAEDQNEFFVVYTGDRQMFEQTETFDQARMQQGQQRGTQLWGDEMRGQQADVAATAITSDELVGTSVYGPGDNWVGEVSDLALTEDGEIEAVIVDVGGFLGIGTHTVALGVDQLQLRRGEGGWFGDDLRAYVNATQEELEQLPEWEQPG